MTPASFDAAAATVPYVPKGMFYSELYLFLTLCRREGVDLVLESGVKHGVSTRILAAVLATWPAQLIAVDRAFFIEPPCGTEFLSGDACHLLPWTAACHPDRRIGVLIDGPKGATALALRDACLTYPNVRVVGIHDVAPGHGETQHSRDTTYRADIGQWLDRRVTPAYATKYPEGPGLGLWVAA